MPDSANAGSVARSVRVASLTINSLAITFLLKNAEDALLALPTF